MVYRTTDSGGFTPPSSAQGEPSKAARSPRSVASDVSAAAGIRGAAAESAPVLEDRKAAVWPGEGAPTLVVSYPKGQDPASRVAAGREKQAERAARRVNDPVPVSPESPWDAARKFVDRALISKEGARSADHVGKQAHCREKYHLPGPQPEDYAAALNKLDARGARLVIDPAAVLRAIAAMPENVRNTISPDVIASLKARVPAEATAAEAPVSPAQPERAREDWQSVDAGSSYADEAVSGPSGGDVPERDEELDAVFDVLNAALGGLDGALKEVTQAALEREMAPEADTPQVQPGSEGRQSAAAQLARGRDTAAAPPHRPGGLLQRLEEEKKRIAAAAAAPTPLERRDIAKPEAASRTWGEWFDSLKVAFIRFCTPKATLDIIDKVNDALAPGKKTGMKSSEAVSRLIFDDPCSCRLNGMGSWALSLLDADEMGKALAGMSEGEKALIDPKIREKFRVPEREGADNLSPHAASVSATSAARAEEARPFETRPAAAVRPAAGAGTVQGRISPRAQEVFTALWGEYVAHLSRAENGQVSWIDALQLDGAEREAVDNNPLRLMKHARTLERAGLDLRADFLATVTARPPRDVPPEQLARRYDEIRAKPYEVSTTEQERAADIKAAADRIRVAWKNSWPGKSEAIRNDDATIQAMYASVRDAVSRLDVTLLPEVTFDEMPRSIASDETERSARNVLATNREKVKNSLLGLATNLATKIGRSIGDNENPSPEDVARMEASVRPLHAVLGPLPENDRKWIVHAVKASLTDYGAAYIDRLPASVKDGLGIASIGTE